MIEGEKTEKTLAERLPSRVRGALLVGFGLVLQAMFGPDTNFKVLIAVVASVAFGAAYLVFGDGVDPFIERHKDWHLDPKNLSWRSVAVMAALLAATGLVKLALTELARPPVDRL